MTRIVTSLLLLLTGILLANSADSTWMATYINDQKVGYALISRKEQNDTVRTVMKSVMKMQRGSAENTLNSVEITTIFEDRNGKPLSFTHSSVSNNQKRTSRGIFSDSGYISVVQNSASGEKKFKIDWPGNALLVEGIRLRYQSGHPVTGDTFSYTTLDCSTLLLENVYGKVSGKEAVRTWSGIDSLSVIEFTYSLENSFIKMTSFVTDDWKEKKVILLQGAIKMIMLECPGDSIDTGINSFDIMTESSISIPEKSVNPCNSMSTVYKLQIPSIMQLPSDDEQAVISQDSGSTTVRVRKLTLNPGIAYPLTNIPSGMNEYLTSTRYIESTDSIVIRIAKKAIRRVKTARRAIQKINRFVQGYITPALDVNYATAGEVASGRRGDCTEYAVLTSALCRASGIPSRIVNGISYLPVAKSFYFHAWTQVFIDEKWISVDPAMRNFDPGHIAISFSKDGLPAYETIKAMGNIKIVDVKPAY